MAYEHRACVSVDECVSMAGNNHLGIAVQFTDAHLDIWGDPTVTGKPRGADMRAGKRSLPVVAALTADSDANAADPTSEAAGAWSRRLT